MRFATAGQGQLQDEIAEVHRRSGLGDRFALLGYRDDAPRLIAAADVFVLASQHEGLPVTVMEALTAGVPVVAPAVGGLPQVVSDGKNGRLVTPGSPTALADAIERASRTTRARSTGRRGRAHRGAVLVGARGGEDRGELRIGSPRRPRS